MRSGQCPRRKLRHLCSTCTGLCPQARTVVNFYEFIWLINKYVFLRIDFTIFILLPQMYDNIKSLRLVKEGGHTVVTAMISSEGEVLEFRHFSKYTQLPVTSAPAL